MPHFFLMTEKDTFTVLILAAGRGERFGSDLPKQYQYVNGKSVLYHTLQVFLSHPAKPDIYVVINEEHQKLYEKAVKGLNLPPPIFGGVTRKESCYKGLKEISKEVQNRFILVHDAARPFVLHQDIDHILNALEDHTSTTLGKPIPETIRRTNEDGILTDHIDRKNCWALQTPQGFHFNKLLESHKTHRDNNDFTDDCGVMEASGHKTKVIKRVSPNIKITFPEDLIEAERNNATR